MNMRGVEHDTVIHISIQFWKEPWPFGMENEKSEIRYIKQEKTNHEKPFLLFQKKHH